MLILLYYMIISKGHVYKRMDRLFASYDPDCLTTLIVMCVCVNNLLSTTSYIFHKRSKNLMEGNFTNYLLSGHDFSPENVF